MYTGATTGVTTNEGQHAFFINENGLPAVKSGSQTIVFSTSGSAFTGSSGSSGQNGTKGSSGSSGASGTSGQDGATGSTGAGGTSGSSGVSGSSGINGVDGAAGTSGINGSTGSAGTSGQTYGTSGSSGATGSSGSSGVSGTNGATALGAASKGGTIPLTGFTYNATTTNWDYDVVFSTPFANTNYSVSINVTDINTDNTPDPYNVFPIWNSEKSVTGFTINTTTDPTSYPNPPRVDWLAVSQGETGVSGAPGSSGTSGGTGSSGSSGANGSSGTSAGGGGGDTLQTQQIGVAASQPTIYGSATQWRSIYGDAIDLDQGSGGQYDNQEFGFIQPLFLEAGETIEKVGFYMMDYTSSGTASFKVIICDKHPNAYLPWNLLHSETLTFTHDNVGNKFISFDYDFTNTGSTRNTYFVYILFASETTRTFEICRTIQNPEYLTNDTRLVTSSNRFDANSHWTTGYHSIYSSLPATMSGILSSYFFYNNQRGGHMYYQTSRP